MQQQQLDGRDIPIAQLVPMSERRISAAEYRKITASIRAVGLIDPLVVFQEKDHYTILDGQLRYQILVELGVETVPCLVWNEKEAFTANRMVNRLSNSQAAKMIRKSLEELDETTIAKAFGLTHIRHRLNKDLMKRLHPKVVALYDADRLSSTCAKELGFVSQKRQQEILRTLQSSGDYGVTMVRALVLQTPSAHRVKMRSGSKTPWSKHANGKSDLLKQLQQAEEQQDFYSSIYRQYSINLLKMVVYVRRLLVNEPIRKFLDQRYPEIVADFESIIASAEGC